MYEVDYIVVGAGLAGSILGWHLIEKGKRVVLISSPEIPSASRVAGGMFNPVTGKYLDKTWMVDEVFNYLEKFYVKVSEKLQKDFFHQVGLLRPFTGEGHRVSALAQIEKFDLYNFIDVVDAGDNINGFFHSDLGGMLSKRAGWLDTTLFLDSVKDFMKERNGFWEEQFDYSLLSIENKGIAYKTLKAEKVFFCEGYFVKDNPYFSWVPFNPAKGEILTGHIEGYNVRSIINQGKWVIPYDGDKVKIGATYSWDELNFESSESDKQQLLETAEKILKVPFIFKKSDAGVRPSTYDRRPIIGKHPEYDNLYIFNGLGTKGVSLAPYFARQLVENILSDEVLIKEVNIKRLYTLYS